MKILTASRFRLALLLASALAAGLLLPRQAHAQGRLVVYAEDWSTSDFYYDASAQAFALNVFAWLTESSSGKRLLFDDTYNQYLPYTQMDADLLANGFTIDRIPTASWTPALLAGYDAVMVENAPIDEVMLRDHLVCGRGVFVVGGGELTPALYNPFLAFYDLSFSPIVDSPEVTTTFVPHPITAGVSILLAGRPSPINVTAPGPLVLSAQDGMNWLVVVGPGSPCEPTPARARSWGSLKIHYR
jgi:hypothetical protein